MVKQRIGIIFGGTSAEHEVSLQSAKNIINTIDKKRFDIVLLGIDKQGYWHIYDAKQCFLNGSNSLHIAINSFEIFHRNIWKKMIDIRNSHSLAQIDVLFPIVHGTLGEDGSLQGMLRMANLPFVGSDVLGSAICMDKDITKRILRDAGLCIAPFITLNKANRENFTFEKISKQLGLPLFVKPANQGSSVGVSKVTKKVQFEQALYLAFQYCHKVVIEKSIRGREIECAVLGNNSPKASTCGEIILNRKFYSYNTKYCKDNNARIMMVPADLNSHINNTIRMIAVKVYQILNCAGMARVDFFLTKENNVIINEVNTLPGFSDNSMYPKLWQASGLSYQDLITFLIELAIERFSVNKTIKCSVNE